MPFRFALQPVLDVRSRAEDDAEVALRAAATARAEARRAVDALHAELTRVRRSLGTDVRALLVEIELIARALACREDDERRAIAREAIARASFATARVERRRIETVRDRARAASERDAERRETVAHEEANAARHNAVTRRASSLHN